MSWERKFHEIPSEVQSKSGVTLGEIRSQLASLADPGLSEGYALMVMDHEVLWGRLEKGSLIFRATDSFDPAYLLKGRIFNAGCELLIQRRGDGTYFTRLRVDGKGTSVEVMDDRQILLGVSTETDPADFTLVQEEAGSSGWIPRRLNPDQRAALLTRNYIEYAGDLLAGYVDSRLMSIEEVRES